jgi:SPP1 family phage portal protein
VYYYLLKLEGLTQKDIKLEFERVEINPLGQIPLFEYKLNKSKLGLVELVKGMLDALNTITSADLDDIEQFVQSLLVFVNQEVDKETLTALLEIGALQIASKDPRNPADVKLLTNKMQHSETKVLYDRIYGNMLTIVGVPKMSDKASSGDTGQARLIGEGWTMADERAKQDELAFKQSERQVLKLALSICKAKSQSGIKNLSAKDIEIKFTRNRSDNMLVKTQALTNLKTAKVAPEVAFTVVGLFSDPTEVVNQSKLYFGEDFWMEEEVNDEKPPENGVESSIVETI